MAQWKVPLADVTVPETDIEAVAEVYRSGWLSMGPETEALERDLAEFAGVPHAIAAANGTAALHLLCAGIELGPGDEVVVPSLTFVATVNAVAYTGARPVFAEVRGLTEPWLSAEAAAAVIGPRTKAIMNMTYGGHPGDTLELAALADERGIALLQDAAHAPGTRLGEGEVAAIGRGGALSFFSNKNLAVGEGGAAVTSDDDLAARMRLLRSHGMTTLTWDRHRGHASGYDVVALGFNYRMDEPRAALARARLRRLRDENAARAELDARYRERLAGVPGVAATEAPPSGCTGSHHLFTVVLDDGLDREAVRSALADAGVQTSVHYPPAHRFSIYADAGADLPLTDRYAAQAVTLPMFAHMTHDQQDLVVDALAGAVAGRSAA
jgi:dTDP-4-amino-4,6-dideoxygalactose transaminase